VVIFKGPSRGPLHPSFRAFFLDINGHSGYLGTSFGANPDCRLGFDCPRYIADTCIGSPQYFQLWFFIPHRVHSLSDFRLSTTFESTAWWACAHTLRLTSPAAATDPSFFTFLSPAFFVW